MKLSLTKSAVASRKLSYVIYYDVIPVDDYAVTDYFGMDARLNYNACFVNGRPGKMMSQS